MLIPLTMLLMCLSGFAVRIQQQMTHEQAHTEAAIAGDRMRIYFNTVQRYARAHPEFRGRVDESELALPAWFLKSWNMGHVLISGRAYVYYTAPPPGLIGYLFNSMYHSAGIGMNQQGMLVSPCAPDPVEVLPPQVPEGSAVITS